MQIFFYKPKVESFKRKKTYFTRHKKINTNKRSYLTSNSCSKIFLSKKKFSIELILKLSILFILGRFFGRRRRLRRSSCKSLQRDVRR